MTYVPRRLLLLLVCALAALGALAPAGSARADNPLARSSASVARRFGADRSPMRRTALGALRPAGARGANLRRTTPLRSPARSTSLARTATAQQQHTATTQLADPPAATTVAAHAATPGASNAVVHAAASPATEPAREPAIGGAAATTRTPRAATNPRLATLRARAIGTRTAAGRGAAGANGGPRVGVMFDLDGTLIDSRQGIFEASMLAAHDAGWNLSEAQVRQISSGAPFHTVVPAVRPGTTHEELDRFVGFYTRHYATVGPQRARMYPTARQAFRALASIGPKVAFGVATAQRTETTKQILEHIGLSSFFKTPSAVFGASGTDVPHKPAPDSLRLVATRLDLLSEDIAVYVGDMPNDIRAARAAGMVSVAVNSSAHGYGDPALIAAERPDYTIRDLSELPGVVQQIMAARAAQQQATPPAQQPATTTTPATTSPRSATTPPRAARWVRPTVWFA